MTLSDVEAVRLRSSDKSSLTRETATGDGTAVYFKLGHKNISDLEVRVDGVITVAGFTLDAANGVVSFDSAVTTGTEVEFTYYWSIFSDDEIQYFVDTAGSNTSIATAYVLLAIAADASKVAKREAMAGGGGLGSVTLDTSVISRELRATAQALIDTEKNSGAVIPSEGLTEPLWTEMSYKEALGQRIIRNN